MPDPRFYEALGPLTLARVAEATGAALVEASGGEGARVVDEVAPLARAGDRSLSFFYDRRYRPSLEHTAAAACFLAPEHAALAPAGCARLVTREPQAAYARAAGRLHRPRRHPAASPSVHPEARLGHDVTLGPGVVVGPGAELGAGVTVGANTVIGPGVAVGEGAHIGGNATVFFALIGARVRVLSGAVIGEAGFGVTAAGTEAIDVPQLGRVLIEDDVTVGANTCIDRGAWDDTVVGAHTKIDNLVQVAHNVRLGRNCVLAAHTGISGSVIVGDGAVFGGRAGVADHVEIGARARIAAAAGVMKNVPPGEMWGGSPARPVRQWLRETSWVTRQLARRGAARADD